MVEDVERDMMAKRVFKYPLEITDSQEVVFDGIVDVLGVAVQGDGLVLYAIVNPDDGRRAKTEVVIRGTGHDLGQDMAGYRFLGTHMTMRGALVWHVWMKDTIEFC